MNRGLEARGARKPSRGQGFRGSSKNLKPLGPMNPRILEPYLVQKEKE